MLAHLHFGVSQASILGPILDLCDDLDDSRSGKSHVNPRIVAVRVRGFKDGSGSK